MLSDFAKLVEDSPLSGCWKFWRSRRDGRQVPLKRRLDPVEMPRQILPHLFLYERTAENRFLCRLAGTGLCSMFAEDPTGRHLDELIPPAAQRSRIVLFEETLNQQRPIVYEGHIAQPGREWVPFLRLLLPVSSNGVAADMVFGMVVLRSPSAFLKPVSPQLGNLGAIIFADDRDLEDAEITPPLDGTGIVSLG
ncbi:MAG TPA: PAS domain-containing protein [Stellaceae bacterium]|nr:PAS domain-containing protein [Stellaceae bacterium]